MKWLAPVALLFLGCQFGACSANAQTQNNNSIQYWLDRGRESYQNYLACMFIESARFASQTCSSPDDIIEASVPTCRELEKPFLKAYASLMTAGYPGNAMKLADLIAMAKPDIKAKILSSQIKRGCK